MPRKAEPSFELKRIIWDIAATVGKDKTTDIQRQLDYELEKSRKEGDFFEDTPDVRTINRIIDKDLNELDPKVVTSKLPPYVWKLRNDYETIKQEGLLIEQAEQARRHDKRIFQKSDSIMTEEKIRSFLKRVRFYCIYHFSELRALIDFTLFFEQESNKYVLPEPRDLCNKMCHNLGELRDFLQEEFDTTKQLKKETRPSAIKFAEATLTARNSGEDVLFLLHPEFRDENFLHFTHPSYRRKGNPTYLTYRDQLDELTKDALESYSAYRAAVRDTLFI